MRDDYRWYNTVHFHKREKMTEKWPEEKDRIYNDERMIPHIRYEQESKIDQQKKTSNSKAGRKKINFFIKRRRKKCFKFLCLLSSRAAGVQSDSKCSRGQA